jgi:hypothetical protein
MSPSGASGKELRSQLAHPPDVLLIDLHHQQEDAMTLVRAMRQALS